MGGTRPRHPVKELEAVLTEAEDQGWRVKRRKYYIMWCPCSERHQKTVHLTPSNPHYEQQLRGRLKNSTCWKDER